MPVGDADVERSLERSRDAYKDVGANSHSHRMGEGEDRNEVRMFQRRDRKREEEKTFNRESSRPVVKSWKDSDAADRSFSREESRRSGSPVYELSKKQRDSSDKSDRPWREKESSEKRYKDGAAHHDRDDYPSSSLWHKNKGNQPSRDMAHKGDHLWKDREYKDRPDHTPKDHAQRDRNDHVRVSHREWKSKGHPRERDYDKGERDGLFKSKSVNTGVETAERHFGSSASERSGGASYRSGGTSVGGEQSSHGHDRDSPSVHKYFSSSAHQDKRGNAFHEARGSERVIEPSPVTPGADNRSLPKLKLKVGGITHTLNSDGKRQSEGGDSVARTPHQSASSLKKRSSSAPEPNRRRQRLILQEDSDEEEDMPPSAKEHVPAEEDGFLAYLAEEPGYRRGLAGMSYDSNQNLQGVRKSSRIPKKRVFDGDDDGEVEPKRRRKKKVEIDSDEDLYRIEEDEIEHGFAEEEEEIEMVNEAKLKFSKRRRKSLDTDFSGGDTRKVVSSVEKMGVFTDSRAGVPLTARQRALQSSKEGLADVGATLIEFPEGLTHSASKKQKEVLTAAERQLKKEEAAQKRRQQVEKAAKEIQATAIQKILCQDSQRKKREGKLQKQREEMEQEKKAAAMAPASNSIRWVLGPNGTEVSFSQDLELPKIFSGPLSYPQEREKCAGPSCTKAYRYRDSKTLLPLCSLECYKAVQKKPSDAGLAH